MERTSSLMYFLAFDAALKNTGQSSLDFNPKKSEGKENRRLIELEFAKLVLLGKIDGIIYQVFELGKICDNPKSPEKRISSNFLTVSLKKASEQSRPFSYPSRPAAPLIEMGESATGFKWGMKLHNDWRQNLPMFFSEIVEPTVFTDLAFFVLRDFSIQSGGPMNYIQALSLLLKEKFTSELSTLWIEKIKKEQVLVKHIINPFTEIYDQFIKKYQSLDKEIGNRGLEFMQDRIIYLESLLKKNAINF